MSSDKSLAWSRDFLILSAIRRKGSIPARVTVVTFPLHLPSCPEGPQDLPQQLLWDQVPDQAQEHEFSNCRGGSDSSRTIVSRLPKEFIISKPT